MTEELVSLATSLLAKEKGFDEVCSNVWHYWGESWHEGRDIFAHSPDKPLPLEIKAMYDDLLKYSPTKNSTLPPHIIARPTQDLLERWLREEKGIHGYVKIKRGSNNYAILPAYSGGYYTTLYEDGEKWESPNVFAQHHVARESWLLHVLTHAL